MRDPVGPGGFLEKRARTKEAFFDTFTPKHNPEGAQVALESVKNTLRKSSKSVAFYRGRALLGGFVGAQGGGENAPEQHASHVCDRKTSENTNIIFRQQIDKFAKRPILHFCTSAVQEADNWPQTLCFTVRIRKCSKSHVHDF